MSLGQYLGASQVTLYDGTVITNPGSTPATSEQCLPFECGADPGNSDVRYWCEFWNQVQTPSCIDPQCAPYRSQIPACNIIASTPAVPNPPQPSPPAALTVQNIVQPLPSIAQADLPVAASVPDNSCWCQINQFLSDNPVIAALILVGFGMAVVPRRTR